MTIYTGIPYKIRVRRFQWDATKATKNFAAHGLSFAVATAVFLDPALVEVDTSRMSDGEARSKAIGTIAGRLYTVVFTMRGDETRIISARRANRTEEAAYGNSSLHT